MEQIVTGEAVVLDLPCARFPTRSLAHLIDLLVQIPLLIGIAVAAIQMPDAASLAAVLVSGFVLVAVGYPVIFETLSRGKTLGKMALGLRVVSEDGGPVRFRQALVRGLAGAVESWALIGVPALITSMISVRAKRLGDVFAGTFVLRERAPEPRPVPLPAAGYAAPAAGPGGPAPDPALAGWSASLDLSALPDPLAASAASYLSRYWELNPASREHLGGQLAGSFSAVVTPPPPAGLPPVAYLGAVLAERRDRELARYTAQAPVTPQPPAPGESPASPDAPPAPSGDLLPPA